jgi:hypothetical protein
VTKGEHKHKIAHQNIENKRHLLPAVVQKEKFTYGPRVGVIDWVEPPAKSDFDRFNFVAVHYHSLDAVSDLYRQE